MIPRTIPALLLPVALLGADVYVDKDDHTAPAGTVRATTDANLLQDRSLLVTGQLAKPEGVFVKLPGRTLAVALARRGDVLLVKTSSHLVSLDPKTMGIVSKLDYPDKDGAGMHGLVVSADGAKAYVSGADRRLFVIDIASDGKLAIARSLPLGPKGGLAPTGLALTPDGKYAVVALSRTNEAVVVDLAAGKVDYRIPVGICPMDVAVSRDGRTAFVSNYGGERPRPGEKTEMSSGSAVAVDARSIPVRGTVTPIVLPKLGEAPLARDPIDVGIHPAAMLLSPDGAALFVANLGDDSVSVVNTGSRRSERTLDIKASADMPFGALCDGLALSKDGRTLFVANAGLNTVASLDLIAAKPAPTYVSTEWYPCSVCGGDDALYVGSVMRGVQKIPFARSAAEVAARDARARENARMIPAQRAAMRSSAGGKPPVPVPAAYGESSVFRHVVYVIKENKTYDQVFGDIGKGNSDPKHCVYPRAVTPNQHALAEKYVLLDNYYCNGILSSDGHAWSVQGMTTPFRELPHRRVAYDFGTDTLCYANCGFIWDLALMNGRSFRNYGELDFTVKVKGKTHDDFYTDWKTKAGETAFRCDYRIEALRRYSCPDFPGWEMSIPDQVRADAFLKELTEFEKKGDFPEVTIIYLPNDHTAGELTARSYVADNDLALGRIVEGLSKSRFWKDTVIFVNEDDPQSGHDHVDGHRSLCLVISPWAKRGEIVSRFYNQCSVIHTLCRIAGLPPLNRMVAGANTMEDCFTDKPDYAPFAALTPSVPLNEKRPPKKTASSWTPGIFLNDEERLARRFAALDFSLPDIIDDDVLNRVNWAEARPGEPYPEAYAGAHGKGLAALGLRLDPDAEDDD